MQILAVGSLLEASNMLGQHLQKQIGQTGIPVYNVANACATGATAVRTGHLAIKAGEADMALAVGVEQMGKMGLLGSAGQARSASRRASSRRAATARSCRWRVCSGRSSCRACSPRPGMEYASHHDGVGFEQFAKVAEKNHAHSTLNPLAQYQKVFSLDEVMGAAMVAYPNTLLMCCPTGDGSAVGGAVLGRQAEDSRPRRAPAGGEDLGLGAHLGPLRRVRHGPARRVAR